MTLLEWCGAMLLVTAGAGLIGSAIEDGLTKIAEALRDRS